MVRTLHGLVRVLVCAGKVNRIDEAKEVMCPRGQNEERHTARYKTLYLSYTVLTLSEP